MSAGQRSTVLWFRRDLRLRDHPALLAAAAEGATLPLFVVDPVLLRGSGPARIAWLAATLAALDEQLGRHGGSLVLRYGDPVGVVAAVAAEVGAATVHVSAETTPYGVRRDERVAARLAAQGRALRATGSPYAVGPGLVRNATGDPYKVFTPFARAWRAHGWPDPAPSPEGVRWLGPSSGTASDPRARRALEERAAGVSTELTAGLPAAGEEAAWHRWRAFRDGALADYEDGRDRPDLDGTSRLSPWLSLGVLHPRSLLADVPAAGTATGAGAAGAAAGTGRFVTELAWREFYADVLHHHPHSAWRDLRPALAGMRYDTPEEAPHAWAAWCEGRTGYPLVDAGMRQLLGEGWMHNRVRMITASFLTKHLHLWWPAGARHFLTHLADADVASNSHGWQWVAGTGTDASPYFRVFNPVAQGRRFDPRGDYVRRWVPELAHLPGPEVHEPWKHPRGHEHGYPPPIVDLAQERAEALARYEEARYEEVRAGEVRAGEVRAGEVRAGARPPRPAR